MSNNNSNNAIKAGIWYTISNFLAKGLVFLTTPLFTRILSRVDFGTYSNFATWQSLLLIIVTFELYSSVARAKYDFEKNIDQYVSTITIMGTIVTIISYVIVIIFMPFFSKLFVLESKYIHIMFIYMLTAPALQVLQAKNRIFMKYKIATFLTLISSIGSILTAVIFTYLATDKLWGRIFGQEITLILCNSAIFVWILIKGKAFKIKYCKYAARIAIPLIPHLLAGNLLGSFDKIVIQKLCGSEDLAFYSLAFNCALLARVLWDSLNQAMVPWLYDNMSVGNKKLIRKVSQYYIVLFMIAAVGIMLLVPEVVFIFGGKSYLEAKYVMPPIIMGACFQFVYSMYVNIEMYQMKTLSISIGTLCAAGLNIPLNYFFVERYGYIAAAYTTMVCYGFLLVFHYLIVKRMEMSYLYDTKLMGGILVIMCSITIGMEYVYKFEIVRHGLIVMYSIIVLLLMWYYRKVINNLMKKVIIKRK